MSISRLPNIIIVLKLFLLWVVSRGSYLWPWAPCKWVNWHVFRVWDVSAETSGGWVGPWWPLPSRAETWQRQPKPRDLGGTQVATTSLIAPKSPGQDPRRAGPFRLQWDLWGQGPTESLSGKTSQVTITSAWMGSCWQDPWYCGKARGTLFVASACSVQMVKVLPMAGGALVRVGAVGLPGRTLPWLWWLRLY